MSTEQKRAQIWFIDPQYSGQMGEPALAKTREELCPSSTIVRVIELSPVTSAAEEMYALIKRAHKLAEYDCSSDGPVDWALYWGDLNALLANIDAARVGEG